MNKPPDLLAAALWYASQGAPVLPLHYPIEQAAHYVCSCSDKACSSPAKHPIGHLVEHGLDDATTDPDVIASWWRRYPRANIGLRTGVTFDALDLDGQDGADAYRRIVEEFGAEPEAFAVVRTGRDDGGTQHYCAPPGRRSFAGGKGGIPAGLDCRGLGGYVVAVPSRHISGRRYQWVHKWGTGTVGTIPWPDVHEWVTSRDEPRTYAPMHTPAGRRVQTVGLGTRYGLSALAAETLTVAQAQQGTRNDQLNRSAYNIGQLIPTGQIDEQSAIDNLRDAGLVSGLEPREVERTINSGISKGAQSPREPTANATPSGVSTNGHQAHSEPDDVAEGADVPDPADDPALKWEIRQQRIRRDARRALADEDAQRRFPWQQVLDQRATLAEELTLPDVDEPYAINEMMPYGGNVALTAQYKTGKTTLINAAAMALADRTPFLGRFDVVGHDRRVVIFNLEMSVHQYRRWWRDVGCAHPERISLVHLRGVRLPLRARITQDWIVACLLDADCETWIIDPFARMITGLDENSNSDVADALDILDNIKARADVPNLILATHTGRAEAEEGNERSRGATRLDDWADVRWILTKDEAGMRYLRAMGRDIDVAEAKLTYEQATRQFTYGGGDREWERGKRIEDDVLDFIAQNRGCGVRDMEDGITGKAVTIRTACKRLVATRQVVVRHDRTNNRTRHYLNDGGIVP